MMTIFSQPLLYTFIFTEINQMAAYCPPLHHFERSQEISHPQSQLSAIG